MARTEIQVNINAHKKEENIQSRHKYAAAALLKIAKIESDSSGSKSARSILSQAMVFLKGQSQPQIAASFLYSGLTAEAATVLEKFVSSPSKSPPYKITMERDD